MVFTQRLIVGRLILGGGIGLVGMVLRPMDSVPIVSFIAIMPMVVALIGLAFGK